MNSFLPLSQTYRCPIRNETYHHAQEHRLVLGVRTVSGGDSGEISASIANIFQDCGVTTKTTSDSNNQNAQALAKAVDQAVKNCLARELMQGGIIWNMKNGR